MAHCARRIHHSGVGANGRPGPHADAENILHVAEVAANQVEAAVAVIAPADGNLVNFESEALCQEQDFDIVHVAVDPLHGEDLFGHVMLEKLEAALGVGYGAQASDIPHEDAKAASAQPAEPGLGPFDLRRRKRSRPDDDGATFGEDGGELIELFDGNFVIGIGEPDDGLGGEADGLTDAAPFAVAAGPADHAQSRILQAQRLDNLAGAIVAIRGDDDLVGIAAILEVADGFPRVEAIRPASLYAGKIRETVCTESLCSRQCTAFVFWKTSGYSHSQAHFD